LISTGAPFLLGVPMLLVYMFGDPTLTETIQTQLKEDLFLLVS